MRRHLDYSHLINPSFQEILDAVTESIGDIQSSTQFGQQAPVTTATTLPLDSLGHDQPPSTAHHSSSLQAHGNAQIVHPMQSNSQMSDRYQSLPEVLSQGYLKQNQPPSTVHHSSSSQAHGNAQIVHPMQSNSQENNRYQSFLEGHQMQFHLRISEYATSYIDQVKEKFENEPQLFDYFIRVMKEFSEGSIDTPGVLQRVSNLFRGHPELIEGFNTFLPPGYRIDMQPNGQPPPSS